ncbi:MAG: hypothetical protein E6R03_01290 [Hyphomicrobiaceae bacterium]|nr:MAG: hypothetical protein E6R03_01290 [Hyphomicrobiaceae bacterium]
MANKSTVFPAYLRMEYDQGDAKARFKADLQEITKVTQAAFANAGKVKLDIGSGDMRQAATDARIYATGMEQLSQVATALAKKTGDTTQATQSYLQALRASAIEANQVARGADAQAVTYERLQRAVDGLAASENKLAAAYRESYAAAARNATIQARSDSFGSNRSLNFDRATGQAPQRATDNGATFSALEKQALAAERAAEAERELAASAATLRAQLDPMLPLRTRLNNELEEAVRLANAGAISERELAQARALALSNYQNAAQQINSSNQAQREASRAADQLQRDLDELRGSIDPLYYATRKYNEEQERANRLLSQGAISTEEHGRAMQVAGAQYGAAMRNAAGSTSNLRQATVQTGQQLQDIAISLYSGQRAGTVFAQQLPQLAFALSSLEGSANKTHNRIGQFATFLSGPWGVAVGLAVGVLATFVAGLFDTEEASKKAEKTTYDFTDAIDYSKLSVDEMSNAMGQLEQAIRSTIDAQKDFIRLNVTVAEQQLAGIDQQIEQARYERDYYTKRMQQYEVGGVPLLPAAGYWYVEKQKRDDADRRYRELTAGRGTAVDNVANARMAASQQRVNEATDEGTRINGEYTRSLEKLNADKLASDRYYGKAPGDRDFFQTPPKFIGDAAYEDEYARLSADKKAREKAWRDSQRDGKKTGRGGRTKRVRDNSNDGIPTTFILPVKATGGVSHFGADRSMAPINGKLIPGRKHKGTDFFAPEGTPVVASAPGVASQKFHKGGLGIYVEIDHGSGVKTRYAHLSKSDIKDGQYVEAGQLVGAVGRTGNAKNTDPHLHYEMLLNGKNVDPLKAKAYIDETDAYNSAIEAQQKAEEAAQRRAEQQLLNSQNIANEIANINAQWDEQPRLIDQSAKAMRDLDMIVSELNGSENADLPDREKRIAEARAARVKASQAVNTELDRYLERGQDELDLLDLQARGLNEQAEIQREINQLDERLGIGRALKGLYEQRDVQKAILEDASATRIERAMALGFLTKTNVEIAKAETLQTKMVEGVTAEFYQRQSVNREIERANRLMDEQVSLLRDVESGLRGVFTGQNNAGDFFKGIEESFKQYGGNRLFDSIFGDAFDLLEQELRKDTPVGRATEQIVSSFDVASKAAERMAEALDLASGAAAANSANRDAAMAQINALQGKLPANDNEIIVESRKAIQSVRVEARSTEDMANRIAKGIVDPLLAGWDEVLGTKFIAGLSGVLTGALAGYMRAGNVGGVIGGAKSIAGILGASDGVLADFDKALGGAERGGQINMLTSAIFGKGRTSRTGSQIGGAIGSFIPIPGGEIIGSVIGSFIGGAFKKKKYGTASLTGSDEFGVYGNSASNREAAEGLGGSVMEGLGRIADALGADIGSFSTSIGLYKGKYRVSSTGRTGKLKAKYGDVTDFGDDEAAAIKFAIADAVKDGAITGLRAATQRLLQQGDDVDTQLQKALDFEGVFTELKSIKDPVGAAIDTLNKEFERLIKIFGEAGASSEEYAQLEELYGIKRAEAIEEANSRVLSSLRGLLDDLTIGDSGLSLRSRLSSAQAAYSPLAARVAAGDTTAYDDYANAARQLLDLQREVYGSTDAYFALLDEVTSLTQTRVNAESNVSSIASGAASPFDTTQVSTAVTDQTQILSSHLVALNDNTIAQNELLETLIQTLTANGYNAAGVIRIGNF